MQQKIFKLTIIISLIKAPERVDGQLSFEQLFMGEVTYRRCFRRLFKPEKVADFLSGRKSGPFGSGSINSDLTDCLSASSANALQRCDKNTSPEIICKSGTSRMQSKTRPVLHSEGMSETNS